MKSIVYAVFATIFKLALALPMAVCGRIFSRSFGSGSSVGFTARRGFLGTSLAASVAILMGLSAAFGAGVQAQSTTQPLGPSGSLFYAVGFSPSSGATYTVLVTPQSGSSYTTMTVELYNSAMTTSLSSPATLTLGDFLGSSQTQSGGGPAYLSNGGGDVIEVHLGTGSAETIEVNNVSPSNYTLVFGLSGSDFILGYVNPDVIWGGEGGDTLVGGGSNDYLLGEAGPDEIWGGDENDYWDGGYGDDEDLMYGEAGNDFIHDDDGTGGDTLDGGDDMDELYSLDFASDTLVGGAGTDYSMQDTGSPSETSVTGVENQAYAFFPLNGATPPAASTNYTGADPFWSYVWMSSDFWGTTSFSGGIRD